MKQKYKIIAGWIAFSFVVLHTTMISISTCPDKIFPAEKKSFFNPYINPLFSQNWRMFYPCPVSDGRLKLKIYYEDEVVDWFYPTETDMIWYKRLRFTYHGELCLLEYNHVFWVWWDLTEAGVVIGDPSTHDRIENFKKTYSYRKTRTYVYGIARRLKDKDPVRAEVICEIKDVSTMKEDVYQFPDYTWKK